MTVREQIRIMESFSTGNRASWYQEVEHLLNQAKSELEKYEIYYNDRFKISGTRVGNSIPLTAITYQ